MELKKSSLIGKSENISLVTDKNFKIEWVNDHFELKTGYSFEQIKGKDPLDLIASENNDKKIIEKIRESIKENKPVSSEILYKNHENKQIWLKISIKPVFDNDGCLDNYIFMASSINNREFFSDKLEKEAIKLKIAHQMTKSGYWEVDLISNISIASQELLNIFESDSFENALDKIHPEDFEFVTEIFNKSTELKEGFNTEFRILLPENRIKHVTALGRIEFDDDDKPLYLIGVVQDITERKLMELEITKQKLIAEDSNKAKSNFLSMMSHEMRTPLNGIMGNIQLLEKSFYSEDKKEIFSPINESANNLLEIVDEILSTISLDNNNIALNLKEFELRNLVTSLPIIFKNKLAEKKNKFNIHIDNTFPEKVIADPLRLRQIIINLIDNAIKFTENGLVELTVTKENLSNNEIKVKFVISDSGIGIPEKDKKNIFKEFYLVDSSTKRKYQGIGLGLNLVKRILDIMNGEIFIESKEKIGTTVTVIFNTKEIENTTNIIETSNESLKTKTILVVEDNEINKRMVVKLLKKIGYDSDTANNGKEALDKAILNDYGVILMDLHMPEMDGFESTYEILSRKPDTKIVALTADVFDETRKRCFSLGMRDFITKPISISELERVLESMQ
jgi:PAS domain S-box-containing protein